MTSTNTRSNFLLNKLGIIVDKINRILESLFISSVKIYVKLIPTKINEKIVNKAQKIFSQMAKIVEFFTKLKKTISSSFGKSKKIASSMQDNVAKTKNKIQHTNFKDKEMYRGFLAIIVAAFSPSLVKCKVWLASLQPATLVGFTVTISITSLTGVGIYKHSKDLAEKAAREEQRAPAAITRKQKREARPDYYKTDEKQLRIRNVILPAYISTSVNDLRKLTIDLTFISSNRYIKEYFSEYNHSHLIKDRLNSTVEPIAVDFPLKNEGKIIIKLKLKTEINKLIKELKIKGEIIEVNIHSIMGT